MIRPLVLVFTALAVAATLTLADPSVTVTWKEGVARVALEGAGPQSRFTVWRSDAAAAEYRAITERDVLCTGERWALDAQAPPGRRYWYRCDLIRPDGACVRFGPYAVTIPGPEERRLDARVLPDPGGGATRVELALPGPPGGATVPGEARLFDAQGRAVRTLHRGPLPPGLTVLHWDGADDAGRQLEAGHYFLRFASPLGTRVRCVTRLAWPGLAAAGATGRVPRLDLERT